jgi:cyclase
MEKIKGNIYVETEYLGCNPSFIVTAHGIVMIDSPLKFVEALQWKKEIQKHGGVAYIINTDHHLDHSLGNYLYDGDLILHEGTMKKYLAKGRIESAKAFIKLMDPPSEHLMEQYYIKKPKFAYRGKMNLYLEGEIFELIHISGHTEDETLVYLPMKKVIFTGDNVCTLGIPNLTESFPLEWLGALATLEEMDIEILVPGHGKIGNKDSIKEFRTELQALINEINKKIDEGLTRDDIMREVTYEDKIHVHYPPATSEKYCQMTKMSIGRLYDVLIGCPGRK